jgi:two-component system chemotaxis response regulator CheB
MDHQKLFVVGASLGGVEALERLAAGLPADFPGTLMVVLHTAPNSPGVLGDILDRAGPLPAALAEQGERIEPGRIYVARPDYHLLVFDSHIALSHGPRENGTRPAIDALFRSAAASFRQNAVGVILTGLLDNGAAGMAAIKRCGGIAIVQDPADALAPDMPRNAQAAAPVDYVTPLDEMPALLTRLARDPANADPPDVPQDIQREVAIAMRGADQDTDGEKIGRLTPLACPECGGPLWEMDDPSVHRYRCNVGHGFTASTLLADQQDALEEALWVAVRTLEERAHLLERMEQDAQQHGRSYSAGSYADHAAEARHHAGVIRRLLLDGKAGDKVQAGA